MGVKSVARAHSSTKEAVVINIKQQTESLESDEATSQPASISTDSQTSRIGKNVKTTTIPDKTSVTNNRQAETNAKKQ